jgi:hypothetical protein
VLSRVPRQRPSAAAFCLLVPYRSVRTVRDQHVAEKRIPDDDGWPQ